MAKVEIDEEEYEKLKKDSRDLAIIGSLSGKLGQEYKRYKYLDDFDKFCRKQKYPGYLEYIKMYEKVKESRLRK